MSSRFFTAFAYIPLLACNSPAPQASATNILDDDVTSMPAPPVPPIAASVAAAIVADEPDGKPVTITLTDGRSLDLRGFKIDAKHGLSDAQCGVTIGRQRIMAMGIDDTDAYTCGDLVATGVLPIDGHVQRIGLIYDVSSPNASFRTAVVLREESRGWQVDGNVSGQFDDTPSG